LDEKVIKERKSATDSSFAHNSSSSDNSNNNNSSARHNDNDFPPQWTAEWNDKINKSSK